MVIAQRAALLGMQKGDLGMSHLSTVLTDTAPYCVMLCDVIAVIML